MIIWQLGGIWKTVKYGIANWINLFFKFIKIINSLPTAPLSSRSRLKDRKCSDVIHFRCYSFRRPLLFYGEKVPHQRNVLMYVQLIHVQENIFSVKYFKSPTKFHDISIFLHLAFAIKWQFCTKIYNHIPAI